METKDQIKLGSETIISLSAAPLWTESATGSETMTSNYNLLHILNKNSKEQKSTFINIRTTGRTKPNQSVEQYFWIDLTHSYSVEESKKSPPPQKNKASYLHFIWLNYWKTPSKKLWSGFTKITELVSGSWFSGDKHQRTCCSLAAQPKSHSAESPFSLQVNVQSKWSWRS